MFCGKCNELAITEATDRTCIRCQGSIVNNLSCICNSCSIEQRVCSICLKKQMPAQNKSGGGGCGCSKKK